MTRNKGIPDRWLAYKNMGNRIAGTPFIAFKVPLAEKYHRLLRQCDRFTPAELVESNPGMRLIIDLTNTQRYYSAESVECRGVNYYKLACPGRVVPTEHLISRFCDVVHDFLSGCANGQDALIGVHCTHGVNRTGFLICSFMVRHLLMHPSEAINAFELARGHHIERKEYVEALMVQYSKSGAGRRRKVPSHGPPPTVSDAIPDDAEEHTVQSYGFGTLHITAPSSTTGSWTITTGPTHIRWKDDGTEAQGSSGGTGPDPEAGPSRKRGPNESFAPVRNHRKGKKDKRTKRNNGQSTSGTEGDEVRSDSSVSAQASGNSREDRANANREKYHQREDPAYGCPPGKKKSWCSPSHLAPHPLQHQLQPRQDQSSSSPPPPPPSSSSQAYSTQRGFGDGDECERDSGTGPASSWRGGSRGRSRGRDRDRGRGGGRGGGGGGGGGGWGRGRGGDKGWDQGSSRGRGHAGADSGDNRAWGRAGGREQGERFGQKRGRGWHRGHQRNTHQRQHDNSSYSRGYE